MNPALIRASYYVGASCLGSADFPCPQRPWSIAFTCSTCGEIWGRIFVPGQGWHISPTPCEKHAPLGVQDAGLIPGSLLQRGRDRSELALMWWAQASDVVPLEVLRREVDLSLRRHDRDS